MWKYQWRVPGRRSLVSDYHACMEMGTPLVRVASAPVQEEFNFFAAMGGALYRDTPDQSRGPLQGGALPPHALWDKLGSAPNDFRLENRCANTFMFTWRAGVVGSFRVGLGFWAGYPLTNVWSSLGVSLGILPFLLYIFVSLMPSFLSVILIYFFFFLRRLISSFRLRTIRS